MIRPGLVWAVARRDLREAFSAPLMWLVLAAWLGLTGAVFATTLNGIHGTAGAAAPLYLQALSSGLFFLVLFAPALTMTAFSQERMQGTMQLLLTVPVTEAELVGGKFLACWIQLAALVLSSLAHPLVLMFVSQVHLPQLACGMLGMVLIAASLAGIGVWISLLVDAPVAAYVVTFGVVVVLILVGIVGGPGWLGDLGRGLGLTTRTEPFLEGCLQLADAAYHLAVAGGSLLLAHGVLTARRIHG